MKYCLQTMDILSPGCNLESYVSNISRISVLTAEQEKSIAERLYYHQDLDAARHLVMSHLRFVVHIARSYAGYGLPQADLIQEGNVGLMKAVKRFNPEVGVRLISFAVHWIKAEIHEFILKNWRIVKIATTKSQRKLFFNLRSCRKRLGWLSKEEAERIAEDLGVETADVHEMEGRISGQDMAFDGYVDDEKKHQSVNLGAEKGNTMWSPSQFLEDTKRNPEFQLETLNWRNHSIKKLKSALKTLDKRSLDILYCRWLTDDKKISLQDLAKRYNISAERVRQLEASALKKLRAHIGDALVGEDNSGLRYPTIVDE